VFAPSSYVYCGIYIRITYKSTFGIKATSFSGSLRKKYGNCIVVIHIGKNLIKKYSSDYSYILSQEEQNYDKESFQQELGDEDFEIRKLHIQFILL